MVRVLVLLWIYSTLAATVKQPFAAADSIHPAEGAEPRLGKFNWRIGLLTP
ncbi:hypothetical protein AB1L30_06105 [Bremerella sp. JC817]|uniref:hypothetical protein n=1 Tax=Bremerella sp. JC817 TaxID=3231756 RepID=UPI00345A9DFC